MSSDRRAAVTAIEAIDERVDLRRAPLADVQSIDFRAADRDFWADEAHVWDRFSAVWAGLDDAAWRLPGAAPSDAGGPDWSFLDHVAHVVDWLEIGQVYVDQAKATGRWPTDEEYSGGDFDTFNETRREAGARRSPVELRAAAAAGRRRLIERARPLPLATIRGDAAWGWVYNILHGHAIDHLRVLEPWADELRRRQTDNDPFGRDPAPRPDDLAAGIERFWADAGPIFAQFDEAVAAVPDAAWTAEGVTEGWSVADHVGHLASWFERAADALEDHRRGGRWAEVSSAGIDAWNAIQMAARRGQTRGELESAYANGRSRLEATTRSMTADEWLDPEGFSWAYEDLHGHVRAHLAMIGPWVARLGWPEER
jgi:hypothetical protein